MFLSSSSSLIIILFRIGLILGIFEAIAYGISQGMIFFGYVIAFRFGAFIVSLDNDHVLHTEFQNVFRVLFALIFGAVAVGQASAFAPNVAKATVSTNRIFSLLDRKPLIDNYSTEGQKLVRTKMQLYCCCNCTVFIAYCGSSLFHFSCL